MIRQAALVFYLMGTVLASATDSESSRVDALIQEQDKNKSKKLSPAQSFVLGNTELRLDESKTQSDGPVVKPPAEASQAIVTLRQPIHENVAVSFSNEMGSQRPDSLPFTQTENQYTINRKDVWALDWTRSNWNGRAYFENQSSGNNEQKLLSAQQTAQGVRTGANFFTGTALSAEMRQENNLAGASPATERSLYQTQLSQKLGNLPFTFEFTPGIENETDVNGQSLSHSTRFNNAIRWQATPDTRLVLGSGVNSKDYSDDSREEAMLYYSELHTTFQKDISFSLRSDFQDLTRNSAGALPYQEQKMNIQIGPRLRLPDNFTAALDMRYGYTQQNGAAGSPAGGETEQALALSIQGRF